MSIHIENIDLLDTASIIHAIVNIPEEYEYTQFTVDATLVIGYDFVSVDSPNDKHIFNDTQALTEHIISEYTEIVEDLPDYVHITVSAISFMDQQLATHMFNNNIYPQPIETILLAQNGQTVRFKVSYKIRILSFYNNTVPYDVDTNNNVICIYGSPKHELFKRVNEYHLYIDTPNMKVLDKHIIGDNAMFKRITNIVFHITPSAFDSFNINITARDYRPIYSAVMYSHLFNVVKIVVKNPNNTYEMFNYYFMLYTVMEYLHYLSVLPAEHYVDITNVLRAPNVKSILTDVVKSIDTNYGRYNSKEKKLAKQIRRVLQKIKANVPHSIASPENPSITPTKTQSKWKLIVYMHGQHYTQLKNNSNNNIYNEYHSVNHVICEKSTLRVCRKNLIYDSKDIIRGNAHYFTIPPEELSNLVVSIHFANPTDYGKVGIFLSRYGGSDENTRIWFPIKNELDRFSKQLNKEVESYSLADLQIQNLDFIQNIQSRIFSAEKVDVMATDILLLFNEWFEENKKILNRYNKTPISLRDIDVIFHTCRVNEDDINPSCFVGYNRSPAFIQTPTTPIPSASSETPKKQTRSQKQSPNKTRGSRPKSQTKKSRPKSL